MNIQSTRNKQNQVEVTRARTSFRIGEASLPSGAKALKLDTNSNSEIDSRDSFLVVREDDGWETVPSRSTLSRKLRQQSLSVDDFRTWKDSSLFRRGDGQIAPEELSPIFPKKVNYAPKWAKTEQRLDPRSESQITLFEKTGVLEFAWDTKSERTVDAPSKNRGQGMVASAVIGGLSVGSLAAVIGGTVGAYMLGSPVEDKLMTSLIGMGFGGLAGFGVGAAAGGAVGGIVGLITGAPEGSFRSEM